MSLGKNNCLVRLSLCYFVLILYRNSLQAQAKEIKGYIGIDHMNLSLNEKRGINILFDESIL